MSADKAVVTLLYRCMLRWNKQLASVPLELRAGHIEEVLPGFRKHYGGTVGSIRDLAELGFRQQVTGIDAWTVSIAIIGHLPHCRKQGQLTVGSQASIAGRQHDQGGASRTPA